MEILRQLNALTEAASRVTTILTDAFDTTIEKYEAKKKKNQTKPIDELTNAVSELFDTLFKG